LAGVRPFFRQICTHDKSDFRMPNFIISKDPTPMNPSLERTMLSSKSYADFAMQNPFNIQIPPGTNLSNILLLKNDERQNRPKL